MGAAIPARGCSIGLSVHTLADRLSPRPGDPLPLRLSHSRAHFLFVAALILLFVGVSIQYTAKVLTPRKDGHTQSAILRWAKQFEEMQDGENIHAKYNYPNPPILPQLLTPIFELVEISPAAGALTWFYLKVGMALVCFVWAFRMVESSGRPYPELAKAVAVAASINPVIGDLKHGNVNIFILFLVMGMLYAFARGRDTLSGLLLGLAIACKVTPALFIVYFVWKRAWRTLIACVLGLILFFLILPSLGFAIQKGSLAEGWKHNWAALTAWKEGMIDPYLVRGEVTSERENQSLPGVLTRLLSREPSFSRWVDGADTPLAYHNVADLSSETIKRVVQACQVGFVLLMIWLCRAPIRAAGAAAGRGASRLAARGRVFAHPGRHAHLQRADVEASLRDPGAAVRGTVLRGICRRFSAVDPAHGSGRAGRCHARDPVADAVGGLWRLDAHRRRRREP